MKRNILLLAVIALFGLTARAQVAMGNWRTHFAYNTVEQIAQSDNKVFAVSEGKLFSIDKRDGSMEFYSKLNGLNGIIISKIGYDEANQVLLIVYQDGNIDFLSADGVKNLPDFYNKQMSADKNVNHILFDNNKGYLSSNFGIITLNMLKMEIQDTYYIGNNASEVKVQNTTIHKGNIYAVSASNIYFASAAEPQLINYEFWKTMAGLPGSGNIQALYSFENTLILLRDGKLYKQDANGVWSDIDTSLSFRGISVSGNYLQAFTLTETYYYNQQFERSQITGISDIQDGTYDAAKSGFWFAAGAQGLASYLPGGSSPVIQFYKPEGPAVNIPYRMKFSGERLFVLQGGRWDIDWKRDGIVMIFENNEWKNIDNESITGKTGKHARDFVDIAIDPADNTHFFTSSYANGVFEFKNDEFFKWHNFENSLIETIYPSDPVTSYLYMRMTGGVFDSGGNVWFANTSASHSIKVLGKDGTWMKLGNKNINSKPTLGDILITSGNPNRKWIVSARYTQGLGILDDNGTIADIADDSSVFHQTFYYTTSDGVKSITPSLIFSIAQDKNGVIWAGTNEGPILFNNPSKAFDSDFTCSRIIIPRNDGTGLGDYLLEDQNITAIAIDGANRKWLGTESSGVYLMSENGQETIHHFTQQNSPLLSSMIQSIAINPVTGEVFFGTSNGLVSFQSDAANAENVFNNVHAYPNPVRENFSGLITITGLVDNTQVKITDVAGNLVNDTKSNGSIATWDGKNKWGEKVSTGVYIAICIAPDGQQSSSTKILVIN